MGHVIVKYPAHRAVYIDEEEDGPTNTLLTVGDGTHKFSLGEPVNYEPASVEVVVENTSVLSPLEIEFEQMD